MDQLDQIERYFRGEMSDIEKSKFEQELNNNSDLRESVDEYINTTKLINSFGFDHKKSHLSQLIIRKRRKNILKGIVFSILIILGILSTYIYVANTASTTPSKQNIYATYFNDYEMSGVKRGSSVSELAEIQDLYTEGEFEKTISKIDSLKTKNSNLLLTKSVSLMRLEKWGQAVNTLNEASMLNESLYNNTIHFYLGLCYVQLNNNTEAKTHFNHISSTKNSYSSRASDILLILQKK